MDYITPHLQPPETVWGKHANNSESEGTRLWNHDDVKRNKHGTREDNRKLWNDSKTLAEFSPIRSQVCHSAFVARQHGYTHKLWMRISASGRKTSSVVDGESKTSSAKPNQRSCLYLPIYKTCIDKYFELSLIVREKHCLSCITTVLRASLCSSYSARLSTYCQDLTLKSSVLK